VYTSLVINNIDFYNKGMNENLPLSFKLGVGVQIYKMVNFDIDMMKYLDTGFRVNAGASYWFRNIVGIRMGGKLGSGQLNHFTWGLGFRQKILGYRAELSYTMLPYSDVGLTQQTYYYCVKACDSADNCSAVSSTVSKYPTGKYTSAASLTSGPTAGNITTKRTTITWSTDRNSDSKVQYGTSSGSYETAAVL